MKYYLHPAIGVVNTKTTQVFDFKNFLGKKILFENEVGEFKVVPETVTRVNRQYMFVPLDISKEIRLINLSLRFFFELLEGFQSKTKEVVQNIVEKEKEIGENCPDEVLYVLMMDSYISDAFKEKYKKWF